MSGVVFIVCVPTEKYEKSLLKDVRKRVTINEFPKLIHYEQSKKVNRPINKSVIPSDEIKDKENQCMEKVLHAILSELNITNSTWCKREEDNYHQVIFSIDSSDRCDEILEIFRENQIGQRFNSVVSVIPCSIQYNASSNSRIHGDGENVDEDHSDKTTGWHRFLTSVRARLTVAQVVENVKVHAALTFDFIFLILISTTMCAIGLVENSNVYLLSSMVICPMMGPVMAGTFGTVIQHRRLLKIGVQNEILGMGIATLVGFCYGSVICSFTDKYGSQTWPTYEMISRGELRSLWVGCLIALLSGAVVALGVLSDNIASLVGVAISTSLTPPAVNAGLLWSLASVYYLKGDLSRRFQNLTLHNYYSDNPIEELLALGGVSICVTFTNIICIYAAGIIVFKIKEVAPIHQKDNARKRFWKHDIKIARDYNKTVQNDGSGECMIAKLSAELAQYQKYNYNEQLFHSTDLTKESLKNNIRRPEYTWSPCMDFNSESLKDLWNKLMKEPGSSSSHATKTSKEHQYRHLSQIFPHGEDKLTDLSSDSARSSGSKHYISGKKKFIVTPCNSDLLLP